MSADAGEDEAVLDVKLPARRRRASDDEAEDAEFHDAAEYAASVAESQALDQEGQTLEELPTEDGDEDGHASNIDGEGAVEAPETEEAPGENDQLEQQAGDRKKAKVREPFEVPTSGAFWLHDDRFGGEELPPEPNRPSGPTERKAKSDTEGRWLHDKFSALEMGDGDDDDSSENAFSHYRRGRGRGVRGGRLGGLRGSPVTGGRGREGISVGRGRGSRYTAPSNADEYSSEPGESGPAPSGPADSQEALPQRQPRAPRPPMAQQQAQTDDAAFSSSARAPAAATTASANVGPGRGRGSIAPRGGRGGGMEYGGRGRGERSYSPEGRHREYGLGTDGGSGGRGRGTLGRGRGRDDGYRVDLASGRGSFTVGGRGAGRGYGRGPGEYEREAGSAAEAVSSSNGRFENGRGRGRGAGRSVGDYQGRGPAPGRGGVGSGRGAPPASRQIPPYQQQQQTFRKPERTMDEEFPPLPGSGAAQRTVPSAGESSQPGAGGLGSHGAPPADGVAPAMQGVRRYSKMAGKVGGAGDAAAAGDTSGPAGSGAEGGRARGAAGEGSGGTGGAAVMRTSKLSAAAPTFEPSPAATNTGRQAPQQPPPLAEQPQQQHPQQPVPSVPAAFGAPLQPMTVVAAAPPVQPMGPGVPEPYGPGAPPLGQPMPYAQQQQLQHQQHPPLPQAQAQMQGYGGPMPPQGMMGGSPMAPQGMQSQYGGGMYGSFQDMEAWFQDSYQKALATGMDPQQAYSAVQGYVQGMQMALQHFSMRGAYPMQGPPPGQ